MRIVDNFVDKWKSECKKHSFLKVENLKAFLCESYKNEEILKKWLNLVVKKKNVC